MPGPVTSRASAGPNDLLAGGACVVRDAQDVLDAMLGPGATRSTAAARRSSPAWPRSSPRSSAARAPATRVAAALGLSGAEAAAALARLELLGYVTCSMLGIYSRTLLPPPTCARYLGCDR